MYIQIQCWNIFQLDLQCNLTLNWRNSAKVDKCSASCDNRLIAFYRYEMRIRCCSKFNAETSSNLICSAISFWIEPTGQQLKRVKNHVKIIKLLFDMDEIMIRCGSPFNPEQLLIWFVLLSHFELKKQCKSRKMFRIMWKSISCLLVGIVGSMYLTL